MKTYILLVTLQIIIFCHWSTASTTDLEQRKPSATGQVITKSLKTMWTWITNGGEQKDTFVARRLKFAVPMIVFKLGVIVTILAFLTIFSLKSLGLLLLLLMLHSSGITAKWTQMKYASQFATQQWAGAKPQNVHLHVHGPKEYHKDGHSHGHYSSHPPDYGPGWYDKNDVDDEYESLDERLKKLNIYDSYFRKH